MVGDLMLPTYLIGLSWENPNLKMDDLETPISMEKKLIMV